MFGPFIKQKPLPGMIGLGGGASALTMAGGPLNSGITATGGTLVTYTDHRKSRASRASFI